MAKVQRPIANFGQSNDQESLAIGAAVERSLYGAPGFLCGARGLQKEAQVHAERGVGLRALPRALAEQAGETEEAGEAGVVVRRNARNDGCDLDAVREPPLGRLLRPAAAFFPSLEERGAFGYLRPPACSSE
jgi:hypothetical protein